MGGPVDGIGARERNLWLALNPHGEGIGFMTKHQTLGGGERKGIFEKRTVDGFLFRCLVRRWIPRCLLDPASRRLSVLLVHPIARMGNVYILAVCLTCF